MKYLIDGKEVPGGIFWTEFANAQFGSGGRFFTRKELYRIVYELKQGMTYKFGNSPVFGIAIN